MFLAKDDWSTMLEMGGSDYAFQKLKRWRAEGPTERKRKVVQFLIGPGYLGTYRPDMSSEEALLLIDLALDWKDFAMWEEVLKKTTIGWFTTQSGLGVLVRAWDVFTFDRTKHMSVHFVLGSNPYFITHLSRRSMCLAESRRPFTALAQWLRSSLSVRSGPAPLPKINKM